MNRLCLICLLVAWPYCAGAEQEDDPRTSEAEHTGQESRFGNFLAIPLIVTEPAIGEGIGGGLVYFHRDGDRDRPRLTSASKLAKTNEKQNPPPTATGLLGVYTSNDTWAAGIGHSRTFNNDSWRMVGALARARINAKIYLADLPFRFTLDGSIVYLNVKNRLGDSPWFIGTSLSIADADATFDIAPDDPARGVLSDFSFTDVGIAAMGIYDTRDDTMMPESGQLFDLTVWRYDEAIGGDFGYTTARFKANSFHRIAEKFVVGLRLEVGSAGGDVPFYAQPFVPLRGIPALRFQGDVAGVAELEGRYRFAERWAGIAFAGVGFVDDIGPAVATEQDIDAWGVGVRFLALRGENVWLGLDYARGPEEDAYYVQLTHPW